MIDLSPMKDIQVNPSERIATAQPGLLWEEFDLATTNFGLATTGGQVSHTGNCGSHAWWRVGLHDGTARRDLRQPPLGGSGHG